jgi:sterol desaturase/sphingolipid hydroxylase (fatty acid hydroxylase superfamily)
MAKNGGGLLRALAIGGALLGASVIESRWPLRRRRESRGPHTARNLAMAALSAAAVSILQGPLLAPVTRDVESRKLGLLQSRALPRAARIAAGVLLLDYTLWWWHWLNHRVPFLWRFHLVHHVDRDLDASTGVRFHFGEMSLSVLYRMLQVRVLGVDATTLTIWQTSLFASIFFHHSNTRLPEDVDRLLTRAIVTPRMHGIHHSDVFEETNSNWASLFTWWDFLHGTMREGISQSSIVIGVPAYQDAESLTLARITMLPFVQQRDDWEGVSDAGKRNDPKGQRGQEGRESPLDAGG